MIDQGFSSIKVNIVGRGNVATHLCKALSDKCEVNCVNPHTLEGLNQYADFIIISVKDEAISEVASQLTNCRGIVAHTSGSTPMSVLKEFSSNGYGVFYPMQTFSKDVDLCYQEIPFFIEGSDENTTNQLSRLAGLISENVEKADSEKRRCLHLASVFACNFVNHLWTLSSEILEESDIDFNLLLPLIKETTRKLSRTTPFAGQTGPAIRNDEDIMKLQRESLSDKPDLLEIYEKISESIIKTHSHSPFSAPKE